MVAEAEVEAEGSMVPRVASAVAHLTAISVAPTRMPNRIPSGNSSTQRPRRSAVVSAMVSGTGATTTTRRTVGSGGKGPLKPVTPRHHHSSNSSNNRPSKPLRSRRWSGRELLK